MKRLHAVQEDDLGAIAHACHEANRAFSLSIGEASPAWADAPEWQRTSCRNGVLAVLCHGMTPEQLHQNWMAEKIKAGWVYGERKNPEAMPPTHPCLVPHGELPGCQQSKDHLFRAVCLAMAKALGLLPEVE
jgi:hypothetical protein